MKKILLIMGVVISSAIGFADAKTDYTNAENLAKNNKITESVKLLESVSNSGDKTYAIKANFQLGAYYLQNNNLTNAKKYLGLVWDDPANNAPEKDEAARLLYTIALNERKPAEAQKYIEWADNKAGANDVDTTSSLIIFYFDNKMQAKGDAKYNTAMKSTNVEYKSEVNYNIGQYYLAKNNMPFRQAHKITGEIVSYCENKNITIEDLSLEEFQNFSKVFQKDILSEITIENCVNKRNSFGGTSIKNVQMQIENAKKYLKI